MTEIACFGSALLVLSASALVGLFAFRRRRGGGGALNAGARHLATQVGALSHLDAHLQIPPARQSWRRIGSLVRS